MALIRYLPQQSFTALIVFLGALVLYLITLSPSISQRHFGTDGAELTASAHIMGVAHPTGYPTYLLLAKTFSLVVPWGDVAYRVNVLSAVSGAGAVVLVYLICLLLIERAFGDSDATSFGANAAAVIAATSFAVSPIPWSHSVMAEVYSLNALFTGLVLLLALLWSRNPGKSLWPMFAAVFLLGVGLGNHLTLLFVALPLAYVIGLHWRELTPGATIKLLGAFIVGLSVYIYLPLRASGNPAINWGDATSLEGFLWTVTAVPYRGLAFGLPLTDLLERVAQWPDLLVRQFNILGLFIGVLGVWRLRVNNLHMLIVTVALFLPSIVFSIMYRSSGAQVYLTPAFMVFAVWLGLGFYWLVSQVVGALALRLRLFVPLRYVIFLTALLAVPGTNLVLNYGGVSLRGDYESIVYARDVIQAVEPDAMILAETDKELFSLWYYSLVEINGTGPTVVSTRLIQFDWYVDGQHRRYPDVVPSEVRGPYNDRVVQVVEFNLRVRPVYITTGADFLLDDFEGREEGDLYRLLSRKS